MVIGALVVIAAIAGCSGNGSKPDTEPTGEGLSKEKHLLTAEPSGGRGIKETRAKSSDGDEVVIVGRIGGSGKPFTGRASFTVVDLSLEPCDDDGCGNPWCSADDKALKQGTVLVKFADENGKTMADDAQTALGLKMLQSVTVRGKAKRDGDGNLSVLASGIYVKP
jgi:hypothetical protein